MRRVPLLSTLAVLASLAAAAPGSASTVSPPANLGELARISRTVVFAEARSSRTELRGETPYTVTDFKILQQVAGEAAGSRISVETAGGEVGRIGFAVTGAPRFESGERYLLFLDPASNGNWRSRMLSYGLLQEDKKTGLLRPLAQTDELDVIARPGVETPGVYKKSELLRQLAAVRAGAPWHREAAEATPAELAELQAAQKTLAGGAIQTKIGTSIPSAPPSCRFVVATGDTLPMRWFGFETTGSTSLWHTTPGQVGISDGGLAAVQQAVSAWTDHADSIIKLNYAGSKPSSAPGHGSGIVAGEVTFNDPFNELAPLVTCSGTVPPGWTSQVCCGTTIAQYGYAYDAQQAIMKDNVSWRPMTAMAILVNDGAQCLGETDFKEMMTHYVGHGLGFEHHADQDATMYVSLGAHPPRGAALGATDRACASFAYHTFLDVPYDFWSWANIEALDNRKITTGCAPGQFCPINFVRRDEMAAFLERALHQPGWVPPTPTGTVFTDVPADQWAAGYIEQLRSDGITTGCAPNQYCPNDPLLRAEMAVFLLRAKHGGSYVPPPASGTLFDDVPPGYWALDWIEQLYTEGITTGCAPRQYCPDRAVQRAEMAAFLVRTFGLPLPQ